MKEKRSQSRWSERLGASVGASLLFVSSTAAYANPDRAHAQLNNLHDRDNWRALRLENRAMRGHGNRHDGLRPIMTPGFRVPEPSINAADAIIYPGMISEFRTSRPHHLANTLRLGRTTYINDRGAIRNLSRGVSLDLGSRVANITVGANLLTGNVTLSEGNSTRVISAGSRVTAAEYAALNEKLATGNQGLSLNKDGAADGGNLNLNNVSNDGNTIRASELVVPENVSVTGDFARAADGVRITKDLVNYGSINAISSNPSKNNAIIAARDIHNETSGSISSLGTPDLNLKLRADRDLSNQGSIQSSGDLELSAGRAIINRGSVSADRNVTLTNTPDADLLVDNRGGTISAANGAINVREADYAGTANSTVVGGDLLSRELNLNAGQGTANVNVNELTGMVNSTGLAAHVTANTSDLVLGTQCLTGDPTYFNSGNIILGGDITVDETLAIIAGGDITTNKTNLTLRTRGTSNKGHDLTIIAGANITAGTGAAPSPLPGQSTGSLSGNAISPVTVSGGSTTGGSIDFTAATGSLTIDTATSFSNGDGANVTMAAFAGTNGTSGRILTNQGVGHQIFTNGNNTGNNGNVSLIAGATASGLAIQIGAIHADGGTGTKVGTGNITISNAQPTTSDGKSITFDIAGSITSGNTLTPSSTIGGGDVIAAPGGGPSLGTRQNLTITSGGATTVGRLDTQFTSVNVFSVGNLTVNEMFHNQGGQVELLSQGDITFNDQVRADNGILVVAGGDLITGTGSGSPALFTNRNGNTGNVTLVAGAAFQVNPGNVTITGQSGAGGSVLFRAGNKIQQLRADSSNNGNAGDVNIIAFNGTVELPVAADFAFSVAANRNGTGTQSGNISIVAGADTANAIFMGGANQGAGNNNYNGSITISASTPNATGGSPVVLSRTAGFAGITSGSFLGGAITPNSSVVITGQLVSNGAAVTLNTGAGGITFNDVERFGDMNVTSLGDINNVGGINVAVNGAGEHKNTLLWTALGDILFDCRFNLHSSGGGGADTTGGGGIALVAGGDIVSILNPFGLEAASIQSTSGFQGGNIFLASGAAFSKAGSTLSITGPSGTGGSLLFNGNGPTGDFLRHIDSHSQGAGFNGGDITLISFGLIDVNPNVVPPNPILFSAAGNGNGSNGVVTIVAPSIVSLPKIDMSAHGGGIIQRYASPGTGGTVDLTANSFAFATIGGTKFLTGALNATPLTISSVPYTTTGTGTTLGYATAANLTVTIPLDVSSNIVGVAGGTILLEGANVSTGTLNVSNTKTDGDAGTISIIANSATQFLLGGGGANGTGVITASAGTATGNGGMVSVTNKGSGGVSVASNPVQTVTSGNGASISLDAGTGTLNLGTLGTTITRDGVGTNKAGGSISLTYGTLLPPASTITLNANGTGTGAGGSISVNNTVGTITLGTALGNFIANTNGGGGSTIDFKAAGALTLSATANITADNIFLSGNGVTINKAINAIDVHLNSSGTLTVNQAIVADPITMTATSTITLGANQTANDGITIVSGQNITASAAVKIDGTNAAGSGGNIVMVAGANFNATASDVTILGKSPTGGTIDFTLGGGSMTLLSSNSTGGGGDGGDITLVAFENGGAGGKVVIPVTIDASGNGVGKNGAITIVGAANSATAINIKGAQSTGGKLATGSINLSVSTPNLTGVSPIQIDGSYTGTFLGGTTKNGDITVTGNLQTDGTIGVTAGGGLITIGNLITDGGDITVVNSGAGGLNVSGFINASGVNAAGDISITSGSGILKVNGVGASNGNGDAGSITVVGNTNSSIDVGSTTALGSGAGADGGQVSITNLGKGGITAGIVNSLGGSGNGGKYSLDALAGGTILFTGGASVNVAGNTGFQSGQIDINGLNLNVTGGTLKLDATGGTVPGGGHISIGLSGKMTTNGNFLLFQGTGNINLGASNGLDTTSAGNGGSVFLSAGQAATANLDILASGAPGNNSSGSVTVFSGAGFDITVGNITADGTGTGTGGTITLQSGNEITIQKISAGGSAGKLGDVTLILTDGSLQTVGVAQVIANTLGVLLNGTTPGNANFNGTSSVNTLFGLNGGSITLDNGATPLIIGGLGNKQSLVATSSSSITTNAALNTTGNITLNTPSWTNSVNITAAQLTVQNLTGNLTINGAGGTITGSNPPGGTPGNPSSPTALLIQTADQGTLNLNGTMNFAGADLEIHNLFGTTTSANGSLFASSKNIILNTAVWNKVGTGDITANNLIVSLLAGATIVNTTGDVTLGSNIILGGHDFAVLASGNINLGGSFTINLSGQNAGDLTLIAGYNFTPNSVIQITTVNPFTATTPSTGSINGANLSINLSNPGAAGTGGNLLAVANGGSVTLGGINTSSLNGTGGSVNVIADKGITTGNINTSGPLGSGDVFMSVATPIVTGTPVVTNGTLSGGSFFAGSVTSGNISVANINAGKGFLSLRTDGAASNINVSGTLTAHGIFLNAGTGSLTIPTNTLTAQRDALNNGGAISIVAGKVTAPAGALTLDATGTGAGTGGFITYNNTSNSAIVLSTSNFVFKAGSSTGGGTINVFGGGDIDVQTGSLNAVGASGAGAQIALIAGKSGTGKLTLTDLAFLSQTDATGGNGNGGSISLQGNGIVFTSSSAAPLQLSANGIGTGSGGSVTYIDKSTVQTFIGAPAKAAKGAANFLDLSATSGVNGGNAGFANVSVGGNLTANSANINVGAQELTGNWSGANIILESGAGLAKGGTLFVNGSLSGDGVNAGSGGLVALKANTTKPFVLNPAKSPKIGVFGTVSALGTGGEVQVSNALGGITVSASNSMLANTISLTTGGKGAIAESKNIVITAANRINLSSATASVGKKALLINTPNVSVTTTGGVNLTNQFIGTTTFDDISVGGSLTLNTNGPTTLNDISTGKGSIFVSSSATNGGVLQITNGSNVVAKDGAVTLQNLDTVNGSILIGDGASVKTTGKGKEVKIAIGAAPSKGTNPSPPGVPPANINVTGAGGTAFFGPGGVSTTGTATVNLVNEDVIFNVIGGKGTIVLGNGVLVEADPPSRGGMISAAASSNQALQAGTTVFTSPFNSQPNSNIPQLPNNIGQLPTINGQLYGTIELLPATNGQSGGITTESGGFSSQTTETNSNLLGAYGTTGDANGVTLLGTAISVAEADDDQESSNGLFVDAAFQNNAGNHQIMNHGNVVFAPVADMTVQSSHGIVKLAAGSVTLFMQSAKGLAVYNLDDHRSNSVVVETHGKKFALTPGRHVLVSNHDSEQFEEVNTVELIQYRGLTKTRLNDGAKVYSSEFSIPSACYAVKPLASLFASKKKEDARLAQHMLKTTAIIMNLNPDRGDFVQFFKPKSMAYANSR